jgi:NAD(P)-dependent dehydrogenase (short-subunit alcohol dehydrogenase family)
MKSIYKTALIVGAGDGLSASVARTFAQDGGMRIALAARNPGKLTGLAKELDACTLACDAAEPAQVKMMFARADEFFGAPPDVVVYNPSFRVRGSIVDIDPAAVAKALAITAYGGFLVAQQAAARMVPRGSGAILFTGASASVKGYPLSASFAMGKFALRGLAQSIARELQPKGIHVAHFVIDGGIRGPRHIEAPDAPDSMLDPDAIAQNYLNVLRQDRSAWTWEMELRPWVERF